MEILSVVEKASFFITVFFSNHLVSLAWIPPQKPPPSSTTDHTQSSFRHIASILTVGSYIKNAFAFLHCIIILMYPSIPDRVCPNSVYISSKLFTWSPYSVLCLGIIIPSCLIRLQAFGELGKDFQYVVTKPNRLYKEGMYAYLQHPSYTALYLLSGACVMFFGRVDGVVGCWLPVWIVKYAPWINWAQFVVNNFAGIWGTMARVREEETMLKETFGSEWEEWHHNTKRFVPRLF